MAMGGGGFGAGRGAGLGLVLVSGGLAAGANGAHHVCACANGLACHGWLHGAGGGFHHVADLAPSLGGSFRAGIIAGGRFGDGTLFGHRQPLGPAHVGHLVGLGCAADLRFGAVLPVARACGADACL